MDECYEEFSASFTSNNQAACVNLKSYSNLNANNLVSSCPTGCTNECYEEYDSAAKIYDGTCATYDITKGTPACPNTLDECNLAGGKGRHDMNDDRSIDVMDLVMLIQTILEYTNVEGPGMPCSANQMEDLQSVISEYLSDTPSCQLLFGDAIKDQFTPDNEEACPCFQIVTDANIMKPFMCHAVNDPTNSDSYTIYDQWMFCSNSWQPNSTG